MAQNRLKWIDQVKGIAMVSVVLCHVVSGLYESNIYPNTNSVLFIIRNICNIFQMPLFCMASGFLFSKAYISQEGYVKKDRLFRQIKSLISIYILWCLIMGIFKIVMSGSVNFEVKPLDLALIWFKPIGVYWYLYVLVGIYLLFVLRSKIKTNDIVIFLFLFVLGIVSSVFVNNEGMLFAFRRIGYYAVVFFAGTVLDKIDEKKQIIIGISASAVSVILTIVFWSQESEIYHLPIVNLLTGMGYSFGIVILFKEISKKCKLRILSYIGKYSLDIYLLHVFFAAGGRMIINRINNIPAWISVSSLFVLALFAPLLIGAFLRKIGIYDLFFKPYSFFESHNKRGIQK